MKRSTKWIFTAVGIVIFLVVGRLLPGEPLGNRAIVVGFGVDLAENDKLIISAQILTTTSAAETAGINSRVVKAEHSTIAGAMNIISERAGLSVALTHCNVVLLGESAAKSPQLYAVLNYLISSSYLSENAYLFATEGNAGDLLNTKTAFGGNASFYAQKIVGLYGDYSDVINRTLLQFISNYHQKGQANWVPLIKKEKAEDEIQGSSGQAGGGSAPKEPDSLFNLNSTMVFRKNEFIAVLEQTDTAALNFVMSKVKKGTLEADGVNSEKIVVYILDKKEKKKYDLDKKEVTISLSFRSILKEIIDFSGTDNFVDRTQLYDEEIRKMEANVRTAVEYLYADMQEKNVDIFGFYENFNSRYGKKAADLSLQDISIKVDVKVDVTY